VVIKSNSFYFVLLFLAARETEFPQHSHGLPNASTMGSLDIANHNRFDSIGKKASISTKPWIACVNRNGRIPHVNERRSIDEIDILGDAD
jgi:hypothetical protein